jgi:uncharacterized protein YuzB (UPF0349 family)
MFKIKGEYRCSKDCEICEGKAYVVVGLEGFINRNLEQDVRDIYEHCENSEFFEFDYPERREE